MPPIVKAILARLQKELSPELTYHNSAHTKDVINEATLLARHDQLGTREIELLTVAAAYHDAGYLVQAVDNEGIGAELAQAAMLKDGDFKHDEIELVMQMILDTKVNPDSSAPITTPTHKLSGYLLDADLANFGRDDFFEKKDLYCREVGEEPSENDRQALQLLERHRWWTPAARGLLEKKKQENLVRLRKIVPGETV